MPNRRSCVYDDLCNAGNGWCINDDSFEGLSAAGSNHPGGINVLFLDGSVRFIKNSINYMTWHALGSRDGGEVVDATAF
jgi:prepilin-type processing-associated H-X9-DG protein